MMRRTSVQIDLWLFVLSAGLLGGASVFEHVVLTPLWAGSLPQSVRDWPHGGIQGRFFMIASPLYGLFSLMLTIASRWMPPPQRKWALMAGLSGFVVVVATVAFFLPILEKTQVTRGAGLTGEEITRLVHQFETWNVGPVGGIDRWLDCSVARVESVVIAGCALTRSLEEGIGRRGIERVWMSLAGC